MASGCQLAGRCPARPTCPRPDYRQLVRDTASAIHSARASRFRGLYGPAHPYENHRPKDPGRDEDIAAASSRTL